jgi:crotonobetainyl-CoA:carnitine CoA-transferase CaiB-like acyl-CoA transferase
MAPLPLHGIRVLDLSRVLAGPLCTMMLGDLGADVIKVERPGHGDETREWGPPFDSSGASAYYLAVNRNKLGVAADFKRDAALVRTLAESADVVVENYLPGALDRAGISRNELLARNPKLVWCSITGFGAESSRPGYDFVVQAESGWMAITGEPNGEPMKAGVAFADIIAGKDATIAILAALAGIGRGNAAERRIVISLVDSARAALINAAQNAMVSGKDATRWGNAHANLVPYQLFRARDRGIVIAVGSDEQWKACVTALGISGLSADARFATNRGRLEHRSHVVDAMQAAVSRRTAAECAALLSNAGVPNGLVKTVLEAIAEAGTASAVTGMPPSAGGSVRLPPPALDQHGSAIRARGWGAFRGSLRGPKTR